MPSIPIRGETARGDVVEEIKVEWEEMMVCQTG
jgi:hypothetical protein